MVGTGKVVFEKEVTFSQLGNTNRLTGGKPNSPNDEDHSSSNALMHCSSEITSLCCTLILPRSLLTFPDIGESGYFSLISCASVFRLLMLLPHRNVSRWVLSLQVIVVLLLT